MSKSFFYIISILLVSGVGGILQYILCCAPVPETAQINAEVVLSENKGLPFTVSDPSGDFAFHTPQNFNFPVSSYVFLTPVDSAVIKGISQLRQYMDLHNGTSLLITGYAFTNEENLSAFPSLGEARANAVKSEFIDQNIPGNQLRISGEYSGEMSFTDSVIYGPVDFRLILPREERADEEQDKQIEDVAEDLEPKSAEKDLAGFAENLKDEPMILHFETGESYVTLTEAERQRISLLNQYIDQNNKAHIIIVGHADNSGSPDMNMTLGKDRAEFLKSYLVRNGFRPDRISTISKGDTEPIASNQTAIGRAENRRAVMTIEE